MAEAIEEFQGKWKVVSLNLDGVTFDARSLQNAVLEVQTGKNLSAYGAHLGTSGLVSARERTGQQTGDCQYLVWIIVA